tara:strand:- start:136 stop:867 length:732 start_codon:yes stop_codon:yes gene_type:complete
MNEEEEKQSYNYLSNVYSESSNPKNEYPTELANYLASNYFKNSKSSFLDVGCGRGDVLKAFSELKFNVEGIDLSTEAAELCKPIKVRNYNLEDPKLRIEKTYDYIFSKSVIEHVDKPLNFLRNCQALLNKGGKLVIMTPSWFHNYWGPFYLDFTHKTPFTIRSLKIALELSGFKNVKVNYFYQLPFIWKYPKIKILSNIIRKLPLPYSPMYDGDTKVKWPDKLNKFIRFSNEVMLLATCDKQD